MSVIDGEMFWSLFEGFRDTAWRWEAQPVFTIADEQPDLQRFLRGEPEPLGHNEDWHHQIKEWAQAGKRISRVRLLAEPVTDYQRYQLAWGIPGNVAAGEEVRILTKDHAVGLDLPDQDFWIFDNHRVVFLNFDQAGRLVDRELVDRPDLDLFLSWRDAAVTRSHAWQDWTRDGARS